MDLREYQKEAKRAVMAAWADGETIPAVILPTGSGKTRTFVSLAHDLVAGGQRVVILVHRDELVSQTVATIRSVESNGWSIGVVKAATNEVTADVIVASCQTLYNERRMDQLVEALDLDSTIVIFDEVHHAASASNRRVLGRLGVFGVPPERTPAVGFTATFVRADAKKLANDWTPVFERTMAWAIEHGWLTDVTAVAVRVPDLDLNVSKNAEGDLGDKGLGAALSASSADSLIPAAWKEHAVLPDGTYRPTILFAPTVASCMDLVAGLQRAGVKTEAVFGTTPADERRAIYGRVRDRTTQVLASVGVLTEGFDEPSISCAIMARPTASRGLFIQMSGRIVRLFPGKDDALLLDVVGATDGMSLCDITDLTRTHDGKTDTSTEAGKAACGCGSVLCCNDEGLRGPCTRNKNLGLCHCQCDCPASGDRESIRLVKGATDTNVDLFRGSASVWLKTYAGQWFIPTRTALVVAKDMGDGTYRAARTHSARSTHADFCSNRPGGRPDKVPCAQQGCACGFIQAAGTDLTTAMNVAQDVASVLDATVTSRDAKWRRASASKEQKDLAKRLGLDVDGMKKGPVSDALSVFFASRLIG